MRSILFCIALLFEYSITLAQTGTAIFNINPDGRITINKEMVRQIGVDNVSYDKYQSSIPITVGKTNFVVKTAACEGEEDGFNVISIFKGDNKLLELKDYDIWTFLYDGRSATNYKMHTNNRYFIPIDLSEQAKALVFVGWPYGGDLPYLTIIVMTEQDVKLVFNQHMWIKTITNKPENKRYTMRVQTRLEEYDSSGNPLIAPTHTDINLENGILVIK